MKGVYEATIKIRVEEEVVDGVDEVTYIAKDYINRFGELYCKLN